MKIAISGGTGLVGSECLKSLLSREEVQTVYHLTRRRTETSTSPDKKLVEVVISDFGELEKDVDQSVQGLHTLFCCLGTTIKKAGSAEAFQAIDLTAVLQFATWGLRRGASHFLVVSSLGADQSSSILYSRTKGLMEQAIQDLGFSCVDIFRPSVLVGHRSEKRAGEQLAIAILNLLSPLMRGRLEKYRPTRAKEVADEMVKCALAPTSREGVRYHYFMRR